MITEAAARETLDALDATHAVTLRMAGDCGAAERVEQWERQAAIWRAARDRIGLLDDEQLLIRRAMEYAAQYAESRAEVWRAHAAQAANLGGEGRR